MPAMRYGISFAHPACFTGDNSFAKAFFNVPQDWQKARSDPLSLYLCFRLLSSGESETT